MKKIVSTLLLITVLLSMLAFAHSGRTDSYGGHWNHSTGTYHYHHGYGAHQHSGGICPYRSHDTSSDQDTEHDDKDPTYFVPSSPPVYNQYDEHDDFIENFGKTDKFIYNAPIIDDSFFDNNESEPDTTIPKNDNKNLENENQSSLSSSDVVCFLILLGALIYVAYILVDYFKNKK